MNKMYRLYFDSEDSCMLWGKDFYFKKEENIIPFIIDQLHKNKKIVEKESGEPLENYIKWVMEHPCWYIDEITFTD